jgi:hypothetical protein
VVVVFVAVVVSYVPLMVLVAIQLGYDNIYIAVDDNCQVHGHDKQPHVDQLPLLYHSQLDEQIYTLVWNTYVY